MKRSELRLPDELFDYLTHAADERGTGRNALIASILHDWMQSDITAVIQMRQLRRMDPLEALERAQQDEDASK